MKKLIDARGLLCPRPVVLTGQAMAENDQVTTIVDNAVAVENVTRLARSKGFAVDINEKPDGIYLTLRKTGEPVESVASEEPVIRCNSGADAGPIVLFVASDSMGRGSAELGERLMDAFLFTLLEIVPQPGTIIFVNAGVKLAVEGSRAVDDLRELASQGVEILACGTCLNYFELADKLAVGRISNMYDIANRLLGAGRVVYL